MKKIFCFLFAIALVNAKPFVTVELQGQLGNQFFQLAAAYCVAADHGAELIVPDLATSKLWNIKKNYEKVFFRFNSRRLDRAIKSHYLQKSNVYLQVPYTPDMNLKGYFMSEKFFAHRREEIMQLFEPHPVIVDYLTEKYSSIINHPKTVAVHVRTYLPDDPTNRYFPFLGWDYFKRAMNMFPEDSCFVVFSDRIDLAKEHLQGMQQQMIFIENEAHYHDFFLISFCKHTIISNSSFSWWAAYLNKNPDKQVIAPSHWYTGWTSIDEVDLIPESWLVIK